MVKSKWSGPCTLKLDYRVLDFNSSGSLFRVWGVETLNYRVHKF